MAQPLRYSTYVMSDARSPAFNSRAFKRAIGRAMRKKEIQDLIRYLFEVFGGDRLVVWGATGTIMYPWDLTPQPQYAAVVLAGKQDGPLQYLGILYTFPPTSAMRATFVPGTIREAGQWTQCTFEMTEGSVRRL